MFRWLALALLGAALAAPAAHAGPDPVQGPVNDGCQRNPAGLLSYSSPEWVFVGGKHADPANAVQLVQGTSKEVHTADEDLPESHHSYDLDFNVAPDPPFFGLLAGDPNAYSGLGNGNWRRDDPSGYGTIHVEWESGVVPTFAWPTEGDRVSVWGQWAWDCGHWGEGIETDPSNPEADIVGTGDYLLPGQGPDLPGGVPTALPPINQEPADLRGEQTELHPMQAIVVTRKAPWQAVTNESETDAYISNTGTHAYGEEKCAHDLPQLVDQKTYGPDFAACVNTSENQLQPIGGRSYEFFVPAPPKPSPRAALRYREVDQPDVANVGHYSERIAERSDGLDVTITFDGAASSEPAALAKSFFVGWENDSTRTPTHLRLNLNSIEVVHSLDPNPDRFQQTGEPPGEYNLYLDANGHWQFIGGRGPLLAVPGEWAPDLGAVSDGQTVPVNKSLDFYVPLGAPVRLQFSGRECDLPRMDPCVATGEVSDGNDHPGFAIATFPSAQAALGTHELDSPTGDYKVSYSIAPVAGVGPCSAPGPSGVPSNGPGTAGCGVVNGCLDLLAPRSAFLRHGTRVRRARLLVRGRASDRSCAGRSGRVARVTVALARRTGAGSCRYLRPNGRFGPVVSCRAPTYVPVRGTTRWKLRLRTTLGRGTYTVRSRAIDAAGNVERKRRLRGRLRNFLTFKLR